MLTSMSHTLATPSLLNHHASSSQGAADLRSSARLVQHRYLQQADIDSAISTGELEARAKKHSVRACAYEIPKFL